MLGLGKPLLIRTILTFFGIYFSILPKFICRWVLLEVLDKISRGSVNWKHASKPPIIMPFRKVENCNQVIKIGKELNFSLVNVAGNDIVQGNKKLILGKYMFSSYLIRTLHTSFFLLLFTTLLIMDRLVS